MRRLLAEELLLLCWNAEAGKPYPPCSSTLAIGVGGALLLDAVLAGAVTVDDGRAHAAGSAPNDPLLRDVAAEIAESRRPPKLEALVSRFKGRFNEVRDRLVAAGALRVEQRRVLRVFPITRYPIVDAGSVEPLRMSVAALLVGQQDPQQAHPQDVLLAALAKPTRAVELLVPDRGARKEAERRAEAFSEGHGIPAAVGQAVQAAQAAAVAAVSAAVAASAASSSSSSSN